MQHPSCGCNLIASLPEIVCWLSLPSNAKCPNTLKCALETRLFVMFLIFSMYLLARKGAVARPRSTRIVGDEKVGAEVTS